MQAPFVCLVVAHGWNIIEDFLAAAHWCGWWWERTRCWVLGEQAPAALFSCPARAVLTVWWVCVCGGLRVGVSVGCVLLWPVLHSCVCLLVGVGVGVSGCGSWFFHSGREHLDIAIVTLSLLGRGLWLWCSV